MSFSKFCRLCLETFQNDCQPLFDTNGQCNAAYNMASKYFDPMILISDQELSIPFLCSICWKHIQDFYSFQQNVYVAHSKLEDVNEIMSVVKLEPERIDHQKIDKQDSNYVFCDPEDLGGNSITSSDDESPLLESFLKIKAKNKQKAKYKESLTKRNTLSKSEDHVYKKEKLAVKECTFENEHSNDSKIFDHNDDHDDVCNTRDVIDNQLKTLENDAFIAAWRSKLDCEKCNETFPNFTLLRKHFNKEHSGEKSYIVCCNRKFRSRYHIVEHIRLHIDPNAYRCDVCGKCSTNSRNLAKHIKELHSEEGKQRSLECPTCLKMLANKNSLRVHMVTHETNLTHTCQECGKVFASEQKRNLHIRYVHNATLICDQCGKTLHNHYTMRQHLLQHAGVKKQKWPCDLCESELNSRSSLKRHKKLMHQDRTTVYVCSECGKVATSEIALLTHKRNVHISGRKHKCTLCDKAFKFPRVLREHMATHTGEDLYQCPYCEKTFKTNANMHHHRKKVHPQEWAEGRLNKPQVTKVDFNLMQNEVVI